MNEVTMRRCSMTGLTFPGTCSSVKSGASAKSSQRTSRQRSPPRIPVSQSWTRATRAPGITPAPLARARGDALSPVLEQIGERLLERNRPAPAEVRLDLLAAAAQDRHVGGPEPGRVLADLDAGQRRLPDQEIQDALDRPVDAGAEVVDVARRAVLEQRPVAADDVAHVGEVTRRLEIADVD